MELQRTLDRIRAQGLGVAAISYDAPAVLKAFASRTGVSFPLLSDGGSAVIRAFGILNEGVPAGTMASGIPHPGTYIVDRNGRVTAKFFEENYTERYTGSDILVRHYGAAAGAARTASETKHLSVSAAASTDRVRAGQRIALTLDIDMKPGMHVYAPGVQGYSAIEWQIANSPAVTAHAAEFPKSKMLRLEAIKETVPVYDAAFRLVRDVTIGKAQPGPLIIEGTLNYQACDDTQCYLPKSIPVKWSLEVEPHDRERAAGAPAGAKK